MGATGGREATTDLQPLRTRPPARTAIGVWWAGVRLQGQHARGTRLHRPQRRADHHQHRRGLGSLSREDAGGDGRALSNGARSLPPRDRTLLLGSADQGQPLARAVPNTLWRRHAGLRRGTEATLRARRTRRLGGAIRQRIRVNASMGGLGGDVRALPAHGGHAGDRACVWTGHRAARRLWRNDPERDHPAPALRRLRRPHHGVVSAHQRAEQPQSQHGPSPISIHSCSANRRSRKLRFVHDVITEHASAELHWKNRWSAAKPGRLPERSIAE